MTAALAPVAGYVTPVAAAPRSGFETAIALSTAPRYLAVQLLGAGDQALGVSAPVAPSAALAGS